MSSTADSGPGSLRQAILDANATPGLDGLLFSLTGDPPHSITLLSALPDVTEGLDIDGRTQAGYSGSPLVVLDGSAAAGAAGLRLASGSIAVRALAIREFPGHGVHVSGGIFSSGNRVEACAISQNGGFGVFLEEVGATEIGSSGAGNSITGNAAGGVRLEGLGSSLRDSFVSDNGGPGVLVEGLGAIVQGNRIGTDETGAFALGNAGDGVRVLDAVAAQIGGLLPGQGNTIASNQGHGVFLGGPSSGASQVQGNRIGTNQDGAQLGNLLDGVRVGGSGNQSVESNTIANSGGAGIFVQDGVSKALRGNLLSANAGLGIDLAPAGPTANDDGDADQDANSLQNHPTLRIAAPSGPGTLVTGELRSIASQSFTLEVFASPACDPSGHGEAAQFLGSRPLTTDGQGVAGFAEVFPVSVPLGAIVSATATDAFGNTSELSACVPVRELTLVRADTGSGRAALLLAVLLLGGGPLAPLAAARVARLRQGLQPIPAAACSSR